MTITINTNTIESMKDLCSIIIRTKNEEQWITKCFKAVYAQSYKNIDVIIVDNCSTDTTISRCKKDYWHPPLGKRSFTFDHRKGGSKACRIWKS